MLFSLIPIVLHAALLSKAAVVERATTSLSVSTSGSYASSPLLYGLMFEVWVSFAS